MARSKKKKADQRSTLPIIHRHAAGIDVGATFHVVAVPESVDSDPVRSFRSFTGDLYRLADWLTDAGVTTVAMESTGIYWVPVFEILESRGFEVYLVNARDAKNVPGRKSEVKDAQWIQKLHEHGLLRASFRPAGKVVALRAYLRHRQRLVEYAASHVQHMQKALMQMNVQLHHVVSDITGVTGMAIVRAIADGVDDADSLAAFRDVRCKASVETIREALTGHYRAEHTFCLRQAIQLYDAYQAQMCDCDAMIEKALHELNGQEQLPSDPLPKPRSKQRAKNEPRFEIRAALYSLIGVDITQIHGLGPYSALKLISECGTDMNRWPTAKHFTSWLSLAPGSKISGGKVLSSKTRRSANRAAGVLRMAALSVGRTSTALGAFYRRLAVRAGKAKAVTATARKIAILFYNTLRYGTAYLDPGTDQYERQYKKRAIKSLRRRAVALGYELVETSPAGT